MAAGEKEESRLPVKAADFFVALQEPPRDRVGHCAGAEPDTEYLPHIHSRESERECGHGVSSAELPLPRMGSGLSARGEEGSWLGAFKHGEGKVQAGYRYGRRTCRCRSNYLRRLSSRGYHG